MARMKKINPRKAVDEKKQAKEIKVVLEILDAYGVELGETIRYRRKDTTDNWSEVEVLGINKDLSLSCFEKSGGMRSFRPGFLVDLERKEKGPRGGTTWVPIGA